MSSGEVRSRRCPTCDVVGRHLKGCPEGDDKISDCVPTFPIQSDFDAHKVKAELDAERAHYERIKNLSQLGIDSRKAEIDSQIEIMKTYMHLKIRQEDWHGVMDAAADLRELVVKKEMIK